MKTCLKGGIYSLLNLSIKKRTIGSSDKDSSFKINMFAIKGPAICERSYGKHRSNRTEVNFSDRRPSELGSR